MSDPIKPTAADEAAAETLFRTILGDVGSYAEWGYTSYREAAQRNIAQAFALHAHQAREQALEEAAKVAECQFDDRGNSRSGHHSETDWTDGYRDGTKAASTAIRALKEQPPC